MNLPDLAERLGAVRLWLDAFSRGYEMCDNPKVLDERIAEQ